ncbi:MAG TPA: MlaD family protein [Alphaproteobacteria bacterium]|nr:MlaD family protein [Alphaproteobacteria bacterium]
MSKRANPVLVGGFIVGAIALVVLALVLFGSVSLFVTRPVAVAYFEGSVSGLSVGAPVTLRGVPVGSVTDIQLVYDSEHKKIYIPVYMEFTPGKLHRIAGQNQKPSLQGAIESGLRAQLQVQSLVTGQLSVEVSFQPGTPIHLVGLDKSVPEIPTVPSTFDVFKAKLSDLPLRELADAAIKTLRDLDALLGSQDAKTLLASLSGSAKAFQGTMQDLQGEIGPLLGNLQKTLTDAQATLKETEKLSADTRKNVDQVATTANAGMAQTFKQLQQTLAESDATLAATQKTVAAAGTLVAQNSQQRADLDELLRNLTIASESIRSFAEQIDRNPNAVIMGK